jgi:hypothetical protein
MVAALALATGVPGAAGAQDHCSRETLKVRETPVTIAYCVSGSPQRTRDGMVTLNVDGNYSAPAGSFARKSTMRFITGEGPSRLLENVELTQLGMTGTLHLTLGYDNDTIHIVSALLTPGAVVVK